MDKKQDTLYIPQGIKKEREYFTGIGLKEVKIIVAAFLAAMVIALVLYLITHIQIIAFFVVLIIPTVTCMGVIKDNSNVSTIDLLRFIFEDSRSQKYYPYIAKDEWEL